MTKPFGRVTGCMMARFRPRCAFVYHLSTRLLVIVQGWDTIVHDLNSNLEKYSMTKEDAVWVTMTIYMAGQETTSTALRVMTLALLHNPAVMQTAQAQLDSVCGDRPPTFEDREKLPYIEALLKETVRWRPGTPMGLLHKASETFEYKGHIIPEGTILVDNIWGQTRDRSRARDLRSDSLPGFGRSYVAGDP